MFLKSHASGLANARQLIGSFHRFNEQGLALRTAIPSSNIAKFGPHFDGGLFLQEQDQIWGPTL